jgi:phosphoribosylaminoimidazole-succinocarboxamide synthase
VENQLLYEGKAKRVYSTSVEDEIFLEYKNSLTANNGTKKGSFSRKGFINAQITTILFKFLEKNGIDTHFISQETNNRLRCKKVTIIPLEVVVRNICAGSFTRRYGIQEGRILAKPVIELFLKDDKLHDPLIADQVAINMDIITSFELSFIKQVALQVNTILSALFTKINLVLVDFKLEFGKTPDNRILLADEITQDTIRLWDKITGEKKDKDRFRNDLGGIKETYENFLSNLVRFKTFEVPQNTTVFLSIKQKPGIIDSVGDITQRSLRRLGYNYINEVKTGKKLEITIKNSLNNKIIRDLEAMNQKLLSNPLIEITELSFGDLS